MSNLNRKLDLASQLAARGKMSRRDFLQLAMAAGLSVPAAHAMFSEAARAEPKTGDSSRSASAMGRRMIRSILQPIPTR